MRLLISILLVLLPGLYGEGAKHAQPAVVLGGTGGLPTLADPEATRAFRQSKNIGFYVHYSSTNPKLFGPTMQSLAKIFSGRPSIAEVSLGHGFNPMFWGLGWTKNVLGYGFAPKVAIVNVEIAKPDAPSGAPDALVEQFKAFASSGRQNKVEILAPVVSPNSSGGGGPDGDGKTLAIMHPWSDPWWDGFRAMARAGGGIAFDAPPAFFLHGLANQKQNLAYQAFTMAALRWAASQHLWSAYIVSPYFDGASFQADSEKVYHILEHGSALPNTWVVENYNECGAPYARDCKKSDPAFQALVGRETEQNTEASVALWFATHAKTATAR